MVSHPCARKALDAGDTQLTVLICGCSMSNKKTTTASKKKTRAKATKKPSSTLPPVSMGPVLTQRYDSGIQHLMAAATFARAAGLLEKEHAGKSYGPFFDEIRWNVSAAVIMSVAALDANLNELLADVSVDEEFLHLIERLPFMDRHQYSLWHLGKQKLDLGKAPAQPVQLLLDFRNELVHPRPEWDNAQKRHKLLGDKLKSAGVPLTSFKIAGVPIYPLRVMSHGCAAWAVKSALNFGETFAVTMRGRSKFKGHAPYLET